MWAKECPQALLPTSWALTVSSSHVFSQKRLQGLNSLLSVHIGNPRGWGLSGCGLSQGSSIPRHKLKLNSRYLCWLCGAEGLLATYMGLSRVFIDRCHGRRLPSFSANTLLYQASRVKNSSLKAYSLFPKILFSCLELLPVPFHRLQMILLLLRFLGLLFPNWSPKVCQICPLTVEDRVILHEQMCVSAPQILMCDSLTGTFYPRMQVQRISI